MDNNIKKAKIIAIIPVRGGSKELPKKNIFPLDGKPLIYYTIQAAKNSKLIDQIFVETDSDEIASISLKFGVEVIPEPEELARDFVVNDDALKYGVLWLNKKGYKPKIIVYLQATDIFRKKGIIDETINTLISKSGADSAFAVFPTHKNYWKKTGSTDLKIGNIPNLPRQNKDCLYREDTGIVCATKPETIEKYGRIGKKPTLVVHDEEFSSIDIHTKDDIWLAEQIVKKFKDSGRYEF